MQEPDSTTKPIIPGLREVRYSLRELIQEVQAERESSTIGQEIVDQTEISKLFTRKKRPRSGKKG